MSQAKGITLNSIKAIADHRERHIYTKNQTKSNSNQKTKQNKTPITKTNKQTHTEVRRKTQLVRCLLELSLISQQGTIEHACNPSAGWRIPGTQAPGNLVKLDTPGTDLVSKNKVQSN